jgi:hypothetical protein
MKDEMPAVSNNLSFLLPINRDLSEESTNSIFNSPLSMPIYSFIKFDNNFPAARYVTMRTILKPSFLTINCTTRRLQIYPAVDVRYLVCCEKPQLPQTTG